MADSRWRALQDEDADQTFAHADALRLYLGYGVRGPERRLRHGGLFLPRRAQLAGCPCADPHRVRFRRRAQKTGPALRLAESERKTLLAAGLVCGTFLFAASAAQQIGITIDPSTAKAAFLTAMYVVLVPVFGLFLGRRGSAQLWVSMVIAVAGLYMLCMKNGFGGIETSDWILLSCAVLFSFQIMSIDHFSPLVDGVRLSLIQFIVVAVESSAAALIFETPTLAEYGANLLPVVYCGVMSSGAGYTLQILGQKDLNPAIASLIMCLESVFSALGGWLLLGQNLSMRESAGCALIFAAVVLSQLPLAELRRCKKSA